MQIKLSKEKNKALYIQLYEAISEDIIMGRLPNGVRLPARRALAEQLGISQNTVEGAYKMLLDTGYIVSIPRQGYIVSFKSLEYHGTRLWEEPAPEIVIFSHNGIDISKINRAAFAKILREISYNDGFDIFSFAYKNGEFALRNAISKYLYSFRDVKCPPDRIIIGAGVEYLLSSLAAIFAPDAALIMENPCYTHFYRSITAFGNKIITLPYNPDNFDFDALYASEGKVLLIDPDARFPRSRSMTREEKKQLLDWANARDDRYIIENGYDAEIQWAPGEPLHSMDKNNKVIYMGSFARSLSPATQTSYVALPPELLALWKRKHAYYYALTPKTEQYALAEFINKGYFTKHHKTMRKTYKDRSNYLVSCLTDAFGDKIKIAGNDGSTYLTVDFDRDSADVTGPVRHKGVKLLSLSSHGFRHTQDEPVPANNRVVFGFGELNNEKIRLGIRLLKDVLS